MIKRWLKNRWQSFNDNKNFNYFLSNETNIDLKDNLNELGKNPHQSTLRILGNGSSLNENLDSFENECDYMVVNRHVYSESFVKIKPKYYVFVDQMGYRTDEGKSILEKIIKDTTWQMKFFVPDKFRSSELSNLFDKNANVHLIYFNSSEYFGPENKRDYCYDHNLAIPKMENVMVAAIYIGIMIRYQAIELYGVEHNWTKSLFVNDDNETCLYDPHFFDKEKVNYRMLNNSFFKRYQLHDILRMYADMFASYWELKKLSDLHDIRILNCTKDSFIDAFERKY